MCQSQWLARLLNLDYRLGINLSTDRPNRYLSSVENQPVSLFSSYNRGGNLNHHFPPKGIWYQETRPGARRCGGFEGSNEPGGRYPMYLTMWDHSKSHMERINIPGRRLFIKYCPTRNCRGSRIDQFEEELIDNKEEGSSAFRIIDWVCPLTSLSSVGHFAINNPKNRENS
jgi:hypothetical protein